MNQFAKYDFVIHSEHGKGFILATLYDNHYLVDFGGRERVVPGAELSLQK